MPGWSRIYDSDSDEDEQTTDRKRAAWVSTDSEAFTIRPIQPVPDPGVPVYRPEVHDQLEGTVEDAVESDNGSTITSSSESTQSCVDESNMTTRMVSS